MPFVAKLVTVAKFKNLTDNLKPFVHFQGSLEDVEVQEDDEIAMLQIDTTDSYFPIFLKLKPTIEEIEEKLSKQEAILNSDAKNMLKQYLAVA
jgi:hypothetical protein